MDLEAVFEQIPALRALPLDERQALAPYAQLLTCQRKQAIFEEGRPTADFTFVVAGMAKLVKCSEVGRETIVNVIGPGELLCANAVCAFQPYCCRAVAMQDGTQVLVVPRRDVYQAMERSPEVARALIREITSRGINLCSRVEELAAGQVERRIATLILRLSEQIGEARDEGVYIPVKLSRQDLADMCGTTIETAIRVMSRFKSQKIVQTAPRGFFVVDRDGLQHIARGAAPTS